MFVLLLCTDSVVERRALRETVFPKLREHCRRSLGLDVRVSTHLSLLNTDPCIENTSDTIFFFQGTT